MGTKSCQRGPFRRLRTTCVAVFYWIALASGSVTADNVMKHGVNNGVILGDVLLSRVPFISYHFQVCACAIVSFERADS